MPYIYPYFEEEFIVIQPKEKKEVQSRCKENIDYNKTDFDDYIDNNLIRLKILDATDLSSLMYNNNKEKPIEITKNVDEIEENDDFIRVPYKNPLGFCIFSLMNKK